MQGSEEEPFYDSLEVAPEGEDFEDWLSGNLEDQDLDSSLEGEWDNYQEEPSFLTLSSEFYEEEFRARRVSSTDYQINLNC